MPSNQEIRSRLLPVDRLVQGASGKNGKPSPPINATSFARQVSSPLLCAPAKRGNPRLASAHMVEAGVLSGRP